MFANFWPSASNFKSFSRSLEQFFLTVGQNNFGKKIPFLYIAHRIQQQISKLQILNTNVSINQIVSDEQNDNK